eukprot:364665-Chlamydomonas_euryale.AAC.6
MARSRQMTPCGSTLIGTGAHKKVGNPPAVRPYCNATAVVAHKKADTALDPHPSATPLSRQLHDTHGLAGTRQVWVRLCVRGVMCGGEWRRAGGRH